MISAEVVRQGSPVVNVDSIHVVVQHEDIVALYIDMHSKNCEILWHVTSDNDLEFAIAATPESHSLKEDVEIEAETEVAIRGLSPKDGWQFFSVFCARYTVKVVLVRRL